MNALKSILRGILNTLEGDSDKLIQDKQLLTCEVCYEIYRDQNPFCVKCFICFGCLDKWFSQQINDQIGNPQCELINLKIFCPSCMKNIRLAEIKKKQSIFSNSLDSLTQFYLKRDESYISCPSPICKNIGWIDNKNCRKYFNCTVCNYRWQNPYKISFMNLIVNQFCPQDVKSRLYKSLFTKSCPNCKSRIQKYGGCRELTCSQCKHSFCWNCKSQTHTDFDIICFMICLFQSVLFLIPFNITLWYLSFYYGLYSLLSNSINLYNFLFQFGYLNLIFFSFRMTYQVGLFYILYQFFIRKKKRIIIFIIADLILWYNFTIWTEIFYIILILGQILIVIYNYKK